MSKSDETPPNATATLKKAVGNANAAFLLWRIVYWCTRKKGGVVDFRRELTQDFH